MKPMLQYIDKNGEYAFSLLKKMVEIQSGSRNTDGLHAMAKLICQQFENTSYGARIVSLPDDRKMAVISSPRADDDANVLLMGHTDTVFGPDSHFRNYTEDDQKAYGPGVADMKGGLIVAILALKAFDQSGLSRRIPIRFLCNPDEEIGSCYSGEMIDKEARKASFGMVFECGGLNGGVVAGRKGRLEADFTIKGQAGHAAFITSQKASALHQLAHLIIELEAMNSLDPDISVNVGLARGGTAHNVVPDHARAFVDIRYLTSAHREMVTRRLKQIEKDEKIAGTQMSLALSHSRHPLAYLDRNKKLYQLVEACGKELGLRVTPELRQGASDACNMAGAGKIPVIDGMGPEGDLDHSDKEYILKDTLLPRTKLAAVSIESAWQAFNSGQL